MLAFMFPGPSAPAPASGPKASPHHKSSASSASIKHTHHSGMLIRTVRTTTVVPEFASNRGMDKQTLIPKPTSRELRTLLSGVDVRAIFGLTSRPVSAPDLGRRLMELGRVFAVMVGGGICRLSIIFVGCSFFRGFFFFSSLILVFFFFIFRLCISVISLLLFIYLAPSDLTVNDFAVLKLVKLVYLRLIFSRLLS